MSGYHDSDAKKSMICHLNSLYKVKDFAEGQDGNQACSFGK